MNDKKVQFLPFHAINDFMRSDYRLDVIRIALNALPELPEEARLPIDRLTKKLVKVPGFRNSIKAPASMKVKPIAEAFEKSPDLVAAILAAWAEAHASLRQQVFELLTARGWEVLPPEANRARLPGFMTKWPKGEDFEVINTAFRERFSDVPAKSDDISLMVVWVGGRLPYEMEDDQEETLETVA